MKKAIDKKLRPCDAYPSRFKMHLAVSSGNTSVSNEDFVWRVVAVAKDNSWRFVNSAVELDDYGSLKSKKLAITLWHEMQRPEYRDLGETYFVRKFKITATEVLDDEQED